MTRGATSSICRSRKGPHCSVSAGSGSRLSGGRHLTVLVMNTSSRESPRAKSMELSSRPARPTKGSPCRSSLAPGPSPIHHPLGIAGAGPEHRAVARAMQRAGDAPPHRGLELRPPEGGDRPPGTRGGSDRTGGGSHPRGRSRIRGGCGYCASRGGGRDRQGTRVRDTPRHGRRRGLRPGRRRRAAGHVDGDPHPGEEAPPLRARDHESGRRTLSPGAIFRRWRARRTCISVSTGPDRAYSPNA